MRPLGGNGHSNKDLVREGRETITKTLKRKGKSGELINQKLKS